MVSRSKVAIPDPRVSPGPNGAAAFWRIVTVTDFPAMHSNEGRKKLRLPLYTALELRRVDDSAVLRNPTNALRICVLASLPFPFSFYSAVKYAGEGKGRKEIRSVRERERERERE